ncbi:DUF4287 domain-containing protein [Pseudoxanthomonas broegbernensis]|nr:DUF4287 domain-containing protein [Pseudoxanthomonas broegbernensis]
MRPASYVPSIEKAHGKPVAHWLRGLDAMKERKHMEQAAHLEEAHKLGHGYATALVAYPRAQRQA